MAVAEGRGIKPSNESQTTSNHVKEQWWSFFCLLSLSLPHSLSLSLVCFRSLSPADLLPPFSLSPSPRPLLFFSLFDFLFAHAIATCFQKASIGIVAPEYRTRVLSVLCKIKPATYLPTYLVRKYNNKAYIERTFWKKKSRVVCFLAV